MPVTDSRQRLGVLTIDSVDYSCQPTAVSIQPQNTSGTTDLVEVLCGDTIDDSTSGGLEANLVFTAIQDFTNAAGLIAASWTNNGDELDFTWQPTSTAADAWTGTVIVQALEVGGNVNERLTTSASWRITGLTLPTTLGGAVVLPAA